MDIFPAIDLSNGQCVRLAQGDFARTTVYGGDPLLQARRFAEAGAEWLHLVDLDGARAGRVCQLDLIERIAQNIPLKLQIGGGIRDENAVQFLLDCGVQRVVIGSLAIQDPARIIEWLRRFGPDHIVVAFDVRMNEAGEPRTLVNAWQEDSSNSLWDALQTYENDGLRTILCTDVARDGMMVGPNFALYEAIRDRRPELDLVASGGVRHTDDLVALSRLGLKGAVVGKAIYEGQIDLTEAIQRVKHAG